MTKKIIKNFEILDRRPCTALCRIKGDVVLFGGFAGYHQNIIEENLPWPQVLVHGDMNSYEDRALNPFDFIFLCSLFKGGGFDLTDMSVKKKIALVGTAPELERTLKVIELTFQGPDRNFFKNAGVESKWRDQYLKEKKYFSLKNKKGKAIHLGQMLSCHELGSALPNRWSVERTKNMFFMIRDLETGECQELDVSPNENETIKPVWDIPPYYGGFPAALAFSLQVLGYGSPFQSKGPTTCMVLRLNGLAVLVDCCPFWDLLAVKTGVSIAEIDALILTHCHEDHMGGLLKLIRRGRKVRIYTAKDIFQMMLFILSWQLDLSTDVIKQYFDFHPVAIEKWTTISGINFFFQYTSHPIPCIAVKARKKHCSGLPAEVQITSDTVGMACAQNMLAQGVISDHRYNQIMNVFKGDVTIADGGEAGLHPALQDFMGHDVRATFFGHRQNEATNVPLHFSFVEPYHLFPFENLSIASIISRAIDSFLKPFPNIDAGRWAQILREAAIYRPIATGQLILQERMEESEFMFIIGFGLFSVITNNQEVAVLHSGNFFGENVFVSGNKKRTAHVKSLTYGIVIGLNADVINEFLNDNPEVKNRFCHLAEVRELLSRTMIFGQLDAVEKTNLALSLNKIQLHAGDYLIKKGETEDCGYVLSHGALEIPGTETVFTPPALVGEFAAAGFTERRTADIRATEDFTVVYEITRNDIKRLMQSNPDIEIKLKELARSRGLKI
ncbi:MAG: cyclic nucleotide-binding domain-containing protein [Syntrophales bacterium]|nr:cyclic nucleotide-binding domain-containing protein [Syntrophales bacterium]MCK9392154.1 cyclic nucleotide-binding domain-containing protein [Syntrophales bacterium]